MADSILLRTSVGEGLTFAKAIGAHRNSVLHSSPTDVDLVRRAFWCLASMDAELSAATGRPVHLALGSYDVSLPDVEVDGKEDANIAAFRLSIGAAELLRKGVETMVSRCRLQKLDMHGTLIHKTRFFRSC